ncbi:RNA-binding S4 domain-containing protein [Desulfotomaculum copahuensis]|uniref:RQC P-site tRNA stabilizing factor n=1 Tax=Desulfotomaculum copahuensis TaxID=1838280 RepID=A0A1B7LCM9_9FIRM|nr:RNA-binding S4 domain-containing protein [Desulfotomaculum copahuensis]OAT80676.1 RNA-binding protein [Desulfotomaculum copahuensis]
MRLDKFLKVSRLIKRRTLAKEACDRGRVGLNGRVAGAGAVVKPGDVITLSLGRRQLKVEILLVAENVPSQRAPEMYRVLEDKTLET